MTAASISRRAFLCGRARVPMFATTDAPTPSPRVAHEATEARVAQIALAHCLSAAYQVCTVCYERCGATRAIALRAGLPVIDEARCTGCGTCADVCPSPLPAIRMRARPSGEGNDR